MSKLLAICGMDLPDLVGYMNVYEEGDIWLKVKGCKGCPNTKLCCGSCWMLTDKGCFLHAGEMKKPFGCVVNYTPQDHIKWCQLEFECVKGTNKGKTKRVKDAEMV